MASIHKSMTSLLREAENNPKLQGRVYVGVTLPEKPKASLTPILVPLPNKYKRNDEALACLVVKDPQKPYVDLFDKSPATKDLFDEVIGVGRLRRRLHGSNKAMDEFCKSFPLIVSQDKVVQPLLEALGPRYKKTCKSLPVPISLDSPIDERRVKQQVREARRCAQIVLKSSDFVSLHVGHTLMDPLKLEENVAAAAKFVRKKWPRAKLNIKTPESASLPIDSLDS